MLMASIVMGLSYASEWFAAWYSGNPQDRGLVLFEFTGAYAKLYYAMLFCNVVAPPDPVGVRDAHKPPRPDRGVGRRSCRHVARAHS